MPFGFKAPKLPFGGKEETKAAPPPPKPQGDGPPWESGRLATAVDNPAPARIVKSLLWAAWHAFVVTAREQPAWLLIGSISVIAFGRCAATMGPRHTALDARTFLGVPSHYDLARRRSQRVLIPLVYGIMHFACRRATAAPWR